MWLSHISASQAQWYGARVMLQPRVTCCPLLLRIQHKVEGMHPP